MKGRAGEKIGWTGGWLGGFLWVAILAVVFLFQKKWAQGLSGIVLTGIAVATVVSVTPWRFPSTPYWKIMLAPYGMLLLSIVWAVWSYGGLDTAGLTWWDLLWCLPLLIPFGNMGNKRWSDPAARTHLGP